MLNAIWGTMIITGIIVTFIRLLLGDTEAVGGLMADLFKSATVAVEVIMGLIGMMCLWLGIANIMEKSGLTQKLAKLLEPLFLVLMPEIPKGHPAISSITLNLSANMLGLDNAATPLGIRAMRDLETLNPNPGTATNSEIMFLVINTSAVTIFPVSIILYRTKFGAAFPTDVFLPILLATTCSTIVGFLSVAIFQKINIFKLPVLLFFTALIGLIFGVVMWSSYAGASLINQSKLLSDSMILFFILAVLLFAIKRSVKIYDEFIAGAKDGFKVCVDILPYLVGMLFAVAVFKGSGVLVYILDGLRYIVNFMGFDNRFVEALPVSLMSSLSGSGARAMMLEVFNSSGVDSFAGHLASVMQGSTETTFYVLAVYFGAVGITKIRHAAICGLIADFAAMIASIGIAYLFFG